MLKFVCFALLISYAVADVVDTSNCGGAGFVEAKIEGCAGKSCTIYRDRPTEIEVTLVPGADIPSGKYLITALYLGFNIEITNVDVCNGFSHQGGCPVSAGEAAVHKHVMTLPSSVPQITATATLRITDSSGGAVVCRNLDITIA